MCCCSHFVEIPQEEPSEFQLNAIDATTNLTDFATRVTWVSASIRDAVRGVGSYVQQNSYVSRLRDRLSIESFWDPLPAANVENVNNSVDLQQIYSSDSTNRSVKRKSKCPICGLLLSTMHIATHMKVHTGEKPFRCDQSGCGKSFARNEELTRHKKIHSGVKTYTCDTCKKGFGRRDHLTKHERTHLDASEKKRYRCFIVGCIHEYTRSDALARHLSTAHANNKNRYTNRGES